MAARQSSRADRAVNPDIFDILGFAECGLAVEHRPDIGAVELVIRERGADHRDRRAGAGAGARGR